MPWVRGGWAEFLAPGLNLRTFTSLRERPEQYRRYVQVRTSNRAYEDTFDWTRFGPLAKKSELGPTMLDEPLKLGGVRFIHDILALGFLNSEEMREDDQYGISGELVTPGDRMLAKRLLNSAGMPGTNNNDINPLADEGLTLMVSNWLTDADAWFLLAAPEESPIIFFWRKMPDTKTWDDENADGTYHKIKQRHSTGFDDWRGAYGSPGA
jgi:hypothetical protein